MNESKPEAAPPKSSAIVGRVIVAIGLMILGLIQALQLVHFKLDWPAFALIVIGACLLLVPLSTLTGLIESLEFGKAKILFRKTQDLQRTVGKAVAEATEKLGFEPNIELVPVLSASGDTSAQIAKDSADAAAVSETVVSLMSLDKDAALIKLSSLLEREIAVLMQRSGLRISAGGIIWSSATKQLQDKGVLSGETVRALLDFRNVRNRIIHSTASYERSETAVISAIDSGLQLLRLLSAS